MSDERLAGNSLNLNNTRAYDCCVCAGCAPKSGRGDARWQARLDRSIPRGERIWLVCVFMGRDSEPGKHPGSSGMVSKKTPKIRVLLLPIHGRSEIVEEPKSCQNEYPEVVQPW